jgi:hypothetical protein
MSVTIQVASDLLPDRFVEITKTATELPSKFYVDYVAEVRSSLGGNVRDPTSAVRFASLDDCKAKINPQAVNLVDSVGQSGFTPSGSQDQVLFFHVVTNAG